MQFLHGRDGEAGAFLADEHFGKDVVGLEGFEREDFRESGDVFEILGFFVALMKLPLRQGSKRNQVARLGGANSALSGRGPVRGCPVAEGRKGDGV